MSGLDSKDFRLSNDVVPEHCRFQVAPDVATKTFRASGTLELTIRRELPSLVLHGVGLTIASATLVAGGRRFSLAVAAHGVSQTLEFTADSAFPAGPATLEVEYAGLLHPDLRGPYVSAGIVVTQFEAADARRAFPCFDEPAFKCTWSLSLVVARDVVALSNGAQEKDETVGGRRVVSFARTPRMSSYLVAFIVGKLASSPRRHAGAVPVRTWSVPEKADLTRFGHDCSVAVLPLLEQYFGRPYAFGKLDNVGIPDFEAGAMENSGCVTYREIALLVDVDRGALPTLKRVSEVITHELAHQWFGNLVTMKWWDDLWLNEAFATWMAYKVVDQWKPAWRMWDDFENGKASALALDAMDSTHPIRGEVRNADQATENFDAITYEKGGAMLRMLEGWLGADAFRDGIRDYMRKHAFENAVADDLWAALARASGQPIVEVANGWIGRPGFPLVTLSTSANVVTLSQRRFWSDPAKFESDPGEPWLVPVVLRWADDTGVHETRTLLREGTATVTLDAAGPVKFVCGNAGGAGFYRVRYDADDLAALVANASALTPVERMNLVADAWAVFRAGAGAVERLLELLVAFSSDADYVVAGEVVGKWDLLERRYVSDVDRPKLQALAARQLRPVFDTVGFERRASDTDADRLLRAAVVRGLALVARDPEIVRLCAIGIQRLLDGDPVAVDVNLVDAAAVAAARDGSPLLFERLVSRLSSDPDPAARRRWLVSVGSFEDASLRALALDLLVTEAVPQQDAAIFVNALVGNRAGQDEAFAFLSSRWKDVLARVSAPFLVRRLAESMGELTRRRADVEAFFDREAATLAHVPAGVRQTRERLRLDEEAVARARPALSAWLAQK